MTPPTDPAIRRWYDSLTLEQREDWQERASMIENDDVPRVEAELRAAVVMGYRA